MAGPLSNLRVIELGGIGPVPHAGMILADLGADVIQVARPDPGPLPRSDVLDRGKRSVTLDLKREAAIVLRMCESSDVLIEGFRPGVAERLGLGPQSCRRVNPRLVYGRMTGWGREGPLASAAGHDIDYIAVTGALAAIGPLEQPIPPLNLVGDFGGGSMLLVVGVLAALNHRTATGEGDVVDAAMVDGTALLMAMHYGAAAQGWWWGERGTDLFDGSAPFYTTYRTADDEWMAVGALEPQFYHDLLEGLGLSQADLPAQMDRDGWPRLRRELSRVFATRTRAEWEDVFRYSDACVTGVYSMSEAAGHPHLAARGTLFDHDGVVQPAPAPRFLTAATGSPGPVPRPGQHTREVLVELGLDAAEISRLCEEAPDPEETR